MKNILLTLMVFGIFGCGESSVLEKEIQLTKAVEKTDYAEGSYWLEMLSSNGVEWDKTILVFGYYDDLEVCMDLKRKWSAEYSRTYRCVAVKN